MRIRSNHMRKWFEVNSMRIGRCTWHHAHTPMHTALHVGIGSSIDLRPISILRFWRILDGRTVTKDLENYLAAMMTAGSNARYKGKRV